MHKQGESDRPIEDLEQKIDAEYIDALRSRLEQSDYMSAAVQSLARELTIEIMEKTYGVPFR